MHIVDRLKQIVYSLWTQIGSDKKKCKLCKNEKQWFLLLKPTNNWIIYTRKRAPFFLETRKDGIVHACSPHYFDSLILQTNGHYYKDKTLTQNV